MRDGLKPAKTERRQKMIIKPGGLYMKNYLLKVDGYTIGIVELTPEEVTELNKDENIIIKEV